MEQTDIPIFKKLYELYKLIHSYRSNIPKADRYSLWQRIENNCLELLELILAASQQAKDAKLPVLQAASIKLNGLRFLIRLAKDTRAIDNKKYLALQALVDEIGRMLGGWLRSTNPDPPPDAFWQKLRLKFRATATPRLLLALSSQLLLTLRPSGLKLRFTRLPSADTIYRFLPESPAVESCL